MGRSFLTPRVVPLHSLMLRCPDQAPPCHITLSRVMPPKSVLCYPWTGPTPPLLLCARSNRFLAAASPRCRCCHPYYPAQRLQQVFYYSPPPLPTSAPLMHHPLYRCSASPSPPPLNNLNSSCSTLSPPLLSDIIPLHVLPLKTLILWQCTTWIYGPVKLLQNVGATTVFYLSSEPNGYERKRKLCLPPHPEKEQKYFLPYNRICRFNRRDNLIEKKCCTNKNLF